MAWHILLLIKLLSCPPEFNKNPGNAGEIIKSYREIPEIAGI